MENTYLVGQKDIFTHLLKFTTYKSRRTIFWVKNVVLD